MNRYLAAAGAFALVAARANAMDLTSAEIANGASLAQEQVYAKCGGQNVSPSLAWTGAPATAKSFAVTVFDPDAHGNGWWHWIAFNIPANVHALAKGAGAKAMPAGSMQGENDFGDNAYDGACPPEGSGLHHYEFTVWAFDTPTIPFDTSVTGAKIEGYLKSHAIAKAQMVPVLQR
jgi:Raf kinase inhibitor-like YbhB/YbcL family protein